jgi:ferredoxin-NADP reductase
MDETAAPKKRTFETYDVTVEAAELLSPHNKHLRFRLPAGREIHFQAGQFVQMFIPLADGKERRTAYSIASSPRETGFFELCVTRVEGGESSTYLHGLKVGEAARCMGPLGTFKFVEDGRDSVFISTGSGIAPFRAMINDRLERGKADPMYLIFGNRFVEDILYRKEWEALALAHGNFKALFTLSRAAWDGPKGYVQAHIDDFVPDPSSKNYYVCGLQNMIESVRQKLETLGVPKERIRFERYD